MGPASPETVGRIGGRRGRRKAQGWPEPALPFPRHLRGIRTGGPTPARGTSARHNDPSRALAPTGPATPPPPSPRGTVALEGGASAPPPQHPGPPLLPGIRGAEPGPWRKGSRPQSPRRSTERQSAPGPLPAGRSGRSLTFSVADVRRRRLQHPLQLGEGQLGQVQQRPVAFQEGADDGEVGARTRAARRSHRRRRRRRRHFELEDGGGGDGGERRRRREEFGGGAEGRQGRRADDRRRSLALSSGRPGGGKRLRPGRRDPTIPRRPGAVEKRVR